MLLYLKTILMFLWVFWKNSLESVFDAIGGSLLLLLSSIIINLFHVETSVMVYNWKLGWNSDSIL